MVIPARIVASYRSSLTRLNLPGPLLMTASLFLGTEMLGELLRRHMAAEPAMLRNLGPAAGAVMALPSMAWAYLVHNRLSLRCARRYGLDLIARLPTFWCLSLILVLVETLAGRTCHPSLLACVLVIAAAVKFGVCARWIWGLAYIDATQASD